MKFNSDNSNCARKEIKSFIYGETISFVRDNPYSMIGVCAAILCHLTPDQLSTEIVESGCSGNKGILKWMDDRNTRINSMTAPCCSYYGCLMAEVFYESKLANYQLVINKLGSSLCQSVGTALNIGNNWHDKKFKFVNNLPPKLLFFINSYMLSGLGMGWNDRWNNVIYNHRKILPGKERFSVFEKLPEKFGEMAGVEICTQQTFGVEIEITTTRTHRIEQFSESLWTDVANQLIACLNATLGNDRVYQEPLDYHGSVEGIDDDEQYGLWKVEADRSVGWEVISPILIGFDGVDELKKALDSINTILSEHDFLCINHRCGLHLNLETFISKNHEWKSFLSRYLRIEPGLFPLMAPARIFKFNPLKFVYSRSDFNEYCSPVSLHETIASEKMKMNIEKDYYDDFKYSSVHIKKILDDDLVRDDVNLLEVRIHNGTCSSLAVISWLALWMKIANHFSFPEESYNFDCFDFFNCEDTDKEDIFKIMDVEGIVLDKKIKKLLFERRKSMQYMWNIAFPEKVIKWRKAGFYENKV